MLPRHALTHLIHCRRGVAAIEAALVIPFMFLILFGFYEGYSYVRAVALVERAVYSVADMTSRQRSALIDCSQATNALNLEVYMVAANKIMSPLALDKGDGEVIISAIDAPSGKAVVRWQRRSTFETEGAKSVVGSQGKYATLPDTNLTPTSDAGDTLIVAEVFFNYTPFAVTKRLIPTSGAILPVKVTISRQAYFHARTAALNALADPTGGCTRLPTP